MLGDLFSFDSKEEPWSYMYTVHFKTLKICTFATDGYDPFIYSSIWDVFRVKAQKSDGRGLFSGIQLIPEAVPAGAEGAQRGQE